VRIAAAGVGALCVLCVAACAPASKSAAVRVEHERGVQRYDNFLAAASASMQLLSAGGDGVLVTSADGGATWVRQELPASSSVVAMSACPDGTFAALDFYRKVWIANAAGRNWQSRRIEANFTPLAITCNLHNRLWAVGSFSTIASSDDQGKSWHALPPGEDTILTAMQWVDADNGFIAGEFGTLLVTHDGGASWAKQTGLPAEFYPYALVFTDTHHGWVSGLMGTILYTADGGKTWAPQTNATGASMYALAQVGGHAFGVGGGGQILRLDGDQWVAVANTPQFPAYLAAVAPLASEVLLVAGAGGALRVVTLPPPIARLSSSGVTRTGQP
jgi:photosystem II stability/assembly factor-like uncharacterized protein